MSKADLDRFTDFMSEYKKEITKDYEEEIKRLNNDIKELLKENENKEKVIKAQDNIINKAIEYIEKNSYTTYETIDDINYYIVRLDTCEDLLDILKGVDKDGNE